MAEPDHLSLCTTPIVLYRGSEAVSQGTGFYFAREKDGQTVLFLVTNLHVLTGSPPGEEEPPIGDKITFQFHLDKSNPAKIRTFEWPLFTKAGHPVWVSHESAPEADLAIIPIPVALYETCEVWCIDSDWAGGELKVRPASNVSLIGYPYGFYDRENAMPVWKSGSVASEPDYDFEGKPLFIVDVSAFPGMSGSPVFAVAYGTYETERGPASVGNVRRFLGVYASMQMREEQKFLEELAHDSQVGITTSESLELGHVWKAKLIIETIDAFDNEAYDREIIGNLR